MNWPLILAWIAFAPVIPFLVIFGGYLVLLTLAGPWLLLGSFLGTEAIRDWCDKRLHWLFYGKD